MSCCGGGEEDIYNQPINPSVAPTNRNVPGNDREPRGPNACRSGAPKKVLRIEIAAIPLPELNRLTNNFGQKALIGEGSYGRVYYATLNTGQAAAIKKLDPSASQDSDSEFEAQVDIELPEDLPLKEAHAIRESLQIKD